MLYGETPAWHMHVSGLMIADPSTAPHGFDAERIKDVLAERLALAPPFKWRIREQVFGLDQPVLVDDPDFNLDSHFHHVTLSKPNRREALGELVGEIMSRPLDRSRALWEVWLIDGLEGGHFGLLTKISHAVIDGASGVDLTSMLMDLEPDPAKPPEVSFPPPDPAPSTVAAAAGAARSVLLTPMRAALYAAQLAEQGLVAGRHLMGGTSAGLPFTAGHCSLNGAITPRRGFAFVDLPLEEVLRVKGIRQVKVNDVILATVAGALRAYLIARDELPAHSLVAEVPVNIRTEATQHDVGTRVANSFVRLATEIADPVERLQAIHTSADDAKALQQELAAHKHINFTDVLPPVLLGAAVRGYGASGLEPLVPPVYSVIVSNVRGPSCDFYMAGARVVGIYPMGPLLFGSGLNFTAFTHGDRVQFGLVTCPDVVPDPWAIADLVPGAFAELAP